jgi:hypothetical protein
LRPLGAAKDAKTSKNDKSKKHARKLLEAGMQNAPGRPGLEFYTLSWNFEQCRKTARRTGVVSTSGRG